MFQIRKNNVVIVAILNGLRVKRSCLHLCKIWWCFHRTSFQLEERLISMITSWLLCPAL